MHDTAARASWYFLGIGIHFNDNKKGFGFDKKAIRILFYLKNLSNFNIYFVFEVTRYELYIGKESSEIQMVS